MKKRISVSLEEKLLEKIEKKRGDVSRSKFISKILERELKC